MTVSSETDTFPGTHRAAAQIVGGVGMVTGAVRPGSGWKGWRPSAPVSPCSR